MGLTSLTAFYNSDSPANLISVSRLLKMGREIKEFTLNKFILCKDQFWIVGFRNVNEL